MKACWLSCVRAAAGNIAHVSPIFGKKFYPLFLDPCGLFRSVAFPVNEFFPPNTVEMPKDYASTRSYCACH